VVKVVSSFQSLRAYGSPCSREAIAVSTDVAVQSDSQYAAVLDTTGRIDIYFEKRSRPNKSVMRGTRGRLPTQLRALALPVVEAHRPIGVLRRARHYTALLEFSQ
jgi:hypothetical protein